MRLLLAEDDSGLRSVLVRALEEQGYIVDAAADGEEALHLVAQHQYALAILDWRMPEVEGIDVVAAIRKAGQSLPVIMLTAKDAPQDRVIGLDTGADDYLVKPFDLQELFARLRAVLRRPQEGGGRRLRCAGLEYDTQSQELLVDGKPVSVTATERRMVELFLRNPGKLTTRDAIAHHVWPDELDTVGSNTVDVHMARLRAKIVGSGARIVTVRGVGFRMEPG
jgi:DNA-binding response OmpR family regulator